MRWTFVSFPALPYALGAATGPRVLASLTVQRPDVILLDSIAAAHIAPWLSVRRAPAPVVAILHQPPGGIDHGPAWSRVLARLDLRAYRHAERVVAASVAVGDEAVAAGVPRDRLVVVAPGRDVAGAAGSVSETPATADAGAGTAGVPAGGAPDLRHGRATALLCVANWIPRKGIVELLDAVARLPADAAALHLVGDDHADPGYRRMVRDRLARPELAGRVVVHGPVPRERVAALYRAADVFVLPSTKEPYGTVYGEAMACGLPVVGWDAGNLPNLARHGEEGLVVAPGDVAGLAAALRRLVDDPSLRRRMAAAAARRAAAFPTWDDSAAALFAVLRDVAGQAVEAAP